MRTIAPREASVGEALALGPALLARASIDRVAYLAASVVRGPAVLLGAAQRAGRVVDLDACAAKGTPAFRRATSGTAAYVGDQAIVWTLALPHVASVVPDATLRTLLNRNVRGFLKGLTRAGALALYFGREWIAVQRRPAALLGFDVSAEGGVLLEVIVGMEASIALPSALASTDERALDRWRGAEPLALGSLVRHDALHLAGLVMTTFAQSAAQSSEQVATIDLPPRAPVTRPDDPMPPDCEARVGARVPIGWVDVGFDPTTRRVWLGGDVLASRLVLDAIARADELVGEVALEGATLDDLRGAVASTRRP